MGATLTRTDAKALTETTNRVSHQAARWASALRLAVELYLEGDIRSDEFDDALGEARILTRTLRQFLDDAEATIRAVEKKR